MTEVPTASWILSLVEPRQLASKHLNDFLGPRKSPPNPAM